jgi:hypothetical protein
MENEISEVVETLYIYTTWMPYKAAKECGQYKYKEFSRLPVTENAAPFQQGKVCLHYGVHTYFQTKQKY